MGQSLTAAEVLVQSLKKRGVDHAFCVPGESYLAVLDALYDEADHIKLITCRHESGASNMADAYGKLTGKPGICFVTRGPGATNASIGIHTAFQDSTPLILFIGQVASDQVEREAFQEIDYRRMFGQMAKWVAQIDDPDRVDEYVNRAFQTATSGRPGPVVLALPEDMLTQMTSLPTMKPHKPVQPHAHEQDVYEAVNKLKTAKRPFVILGGSGWNKEGLANIKLFLNRNKIPAGCAFRFQDTLENDDDCYVGDVGIGINPALAARIKDSDCLMVIGPRLGEMTTSGYTLLQPPVHDQTLIHVHAGAEELGRVYQADLLINAQPSSFANQLAGVDLGRSDDDAYWLSEAKQDYLDWTTPRQNAGNVQVAEIWQSLREQLPRNAIITNGAGNYAAWLHRYYRYRGYKTQLAPTSGAMGYGVPAAIAAKIVEPNRTVVCAAGDGCFMMTSQELATAMQYDAAVIFLVFNNSMYGTIRMHQEKHYPKRVSATALQNPDFVAYAKSFGLEAYRVTETSQFMDAFKKAEAAGKAALIEVMVDPEAISPAANLSDLGK